MAVPWFGCRARRKECWPQRLVTSSPTNWDTTRKIYRLQQSRKLWARRTRTVRPGRSQTPPPFSQVGLRANLTGACVVFLRHKQPLIPESRLSKTKPLTLASGLPRGSPPTLSCLATTFFDHRNPLSTVRAVREIQESLLKSAVIRGSRANGKLKPLLFSFQPDKIGLGCRSRSSHFHLRHFTTSVLGTRRCGEMADAQDLKSWDRKKSCEFESHHRHQPSLIASR